MSISPSLRPVGFACRLISVLLLGGCGSSSGPTGGPVAGAADQHCHVAGALQATKVGMCLPESAGDDAAAPADDAGAADDAAATDDGGAVSEYGPPLFNDVGYDDDCKYHVSYKSTPIRRNENVTFTVTIEGLDPSGPATKAGLYAEVTLGDDHAVSGGDAVETPAGSGIYVVGPIKFDRAGQWVVRFHVYGDCSDTPEDSPHGHVAFLVQVP